MASVFYAYAGYALWLSVRRKWRSMPRQWSPILPSISIVMAVRNEAAALAAKIKNLEALDYPRDKVAIIVVSDGSTDATNEVLAGFGSRVQPIFLPVPEGKASALNHALAVAKSEIVVFVDVRQQLDSQALRFLAGNFADPSVGCASGELVLTESLESKAESVGLYWKIEKQIRKLESETGSVVGATGALYAVRRELVPVVPAGTLCDDVYIPFEVVRQNRRVVFESRAIAFDVIFSDWRREFRRKVRTLAGNYQLLRLAPWLMTSTNPLRFELFSHKLLRLAAPFILLLALAGSFLAQGWFYRVAFFCQLGFYALALLVVVLPKSRPPRVAALAFTFVMLNVAAVFALVKFMTGAKDVWVNTKLQPGQIQ